MSMENKKTQLKVHGLGLKIRKKKIGFLAVYIISFDNNFLLLTASIN